MPLHFVLSTRRRWTLASLLAIALFAALNCTATAEETPEQKLLESVVRIWDQAGHSAFTDLIEFQGQLYCTFREGSGHIPGLNGTIRVLRSADRMNWESVATLSQPSVDLRDPKLSITPDGRLMLTMGASYYHGNQRKSIESRTSFSDAVGLNFEPPQKVIFPDEVITCFDWLWRVTWHNGTAWGCLQQVPDRDRRSLQVVKSQDGIHFTVVAKLDVAGANETTLRFLPDGTMLAMIRTETGEALGHVGWSKPPYTDWNITATNRRFGGPNIVQLPNGAWLAGSRSYDPKGASTQVWKFDVDRNAFDVLLTLPSGGDTSYPGFVIDADNERVYMSYYSTHEGKSAIYLATLRLPELLKATSHASP